LNTNNNRRLWRFIFYLNRLTIFNGSSLFRIYVPFEEIPEIESLFQPMESLKANSKYDFMGSRLYTFKRIDSYCGTNFAEVYLGTIDKNQ